MNKLCSDLAGLDDDSLSGALQELRGTFRVFDAKVDASSLGLQRHALLRLLGDCGIRLVDGQLDRLVVADADGDALVNYRDVYRLVAAFQGLTWRSENGREVREMFEILSDGRGVVQRDLLKRCMQHLGTCPASEPAATEFVDDLYREAGVDEDGEIDYVDFERMIQSVPRGRGSVM